ncbi:MAG: Dabb family protein [Herbinix sp.]|jgi:hypothetical protein|nr:Dabb family protein [Herbinix sp.]
MVINNLLIKLKESDKDSIDKTREVLLSMKGKINVLLNIQIEADIRRGESSYDILLITHFSTMSDLEAYLIHPVHLEVSKYIAEVIASSAAVCYEV